MATKKKADDEVVETEATEVEDVAAEDAADAAVEEFTGEVGKQGDGAGADAVGPAVNSIFTPDPAIVPAPITAHTGPAAKHRRVLYENTVNEGAEAFAARARATYTEVVLAGGTVELVVTFPDLPTDDQE